MNIFPDHDLEQIVQRVNARWDLSGEFPMPRWQPACPCCGSDDIQARHWTFGKRPGHRVEHRCDVSMKCCDCSLVFTFGVPIPSSMYQAKPNQYAWREVRRRLEKAERAHAA